MVVLELCNTWYRRCVHRKSAGTCTLQKEGKCNNCYSAPNPYNSVYIISVLHSAILSKFIGNTSLTKLIWGTYFRLHKFLGSNKTLRYTIFCSNIDLMIFCIDQLDNIHDVQLCCRLPHSELHFKTVRMEASRNTVQR